AVTADRSSADLAEIAATVAPDAIQLSGNESLESLAAVPLPVWKVLHLAADGSDVAALDAAAPDTASGVVRTASAYVGAGASRILLDAAGGMYQGGTGRRISPDLVMAIAREVPVVLAGGLDPAS